MTFVNDQVQFAAALHCKTFWLLLAFRCGYHKMIRAFSLCGLFVSCAAMWVHNKSHLYWGTKIRGSTTSERQKSKHWHVYIHCLELLHDVITRHLFFSHTGRQVWREIKFLDNHWSCFWFQWLKMSSDFDTFSI